jgi:hypothetical protein
MATSLALVVEPDASLRHLMRDAVRRAGLDVIECSNPLQLKVEVRAPKVIEAAELFCVVSVDIARHCGPELTDLFRARVRHGRPEVRMGYTCEFCAPQPPLSFSHCELVAMLEKPFALEELEELARGRRVAERGSVLDSFAAGNVCLPCGISRP